MFKKDTTFFAIMAGSIAGLLLMCMVFSCGMSGDKSPDSAVKVTETTAEVNTTAEPQQTDSTEETTTTTENTDSDAQKKHYAVEVTGDALNIRSGPGMEYDKIGTAYNGNRYYYLGEEKASDGKLWYKINAFSTTGWLSASFAELDEISASEIDGLVNPKTTKSTTTTSTAENSTKATTEPTTASQTEKTTSETEPSGDESVG